MSGVGGAKVVSMDLYATIRNKEVLVVDYRNREANGVWIGSNSCLDKQFQNWELESVEALVVLFFHFIVQLCGRRGWGGFRRHMVEWESS